MSCIFKHCSQKLYHVALISFQLTFCGRLSKCQAVLNTAGEPCLASKAVGNGLTITLVWKMTSAHALKYLNSFEYVFEISLPSHTAQTSARDVKIKLLSHRHRTFGIAICLSSKEFYCTRAMGPPVGCQSQYILVLLHPCLQDEEPHLQYHLTSMGSAETVSLSCQTNSYSIRSVSGRVIFVKLQCGGWA